jgi:hypothetical protein
MDTKDNKDSLTFPEMRTIFIFLALAAIALTLVYFREPKEPEFRQVIEEIESSDSNSMDKEFVEIPTDGKSETPPRMVGEDAAYLQQPGDKADAAAKSEPVPDAVMILEQQSKASTKVANKLEDRLEKMGHRLQKLEKEMIRRSANGSVFPIAKMSPCERTALEFIRLIGTYTPQTAKGRFEAAKALVHKDSMADYENFIKSEVKTISEGRRSLNLAIEQLPIRCSPAKTEKDKSSQRWVFKAVGSQSAAFGYEVAGRSDVAYLLVMGVGKDEFFQRNVPQVLEFSTHPAEMTKAKGKEG